MTNYLEFEVSHLPEATFNNPSYVAGTSLYSLGIHEDLIDCLDPQPKVQSTFVVGTRNSCTNNVTMMVSPEKAFPIVLQNGTIFWYAIGDDTAGNVNAGAGPYTHTFAGVNTTALKSFMLHVEAIHATSDFIRDYKGCKINTLELMYSQDIPYLIAKPHIISCQSAAGTKLDNAAALPATATTGLYKNLTTATWGGAAIYPKGITLQFKNYLKPLAGVGTAPLTYSHIEETNKFEALGILLFDAQGYQEWTDAVTPTQTKELILKWTKSTNDYIQITLTNCTVTNPSYNIPKPGDILVAGIGYKAESVSVEVKDSIYYDDNYAA